MASDEISIVIAANFFFHSASPIITHWGFVCFVCFN